MRGQIGPGFYLIELLARGLCPRTLDEGVRLLLRAYKLLGNILREAEAQAEHWRKKCAEEKGEGKDGR